LSVFLVVAYGNPLRGDDGVGWRIAESLPHTPEREILCVHQLMPELCCRLCSADGVLFLDAGIGDEPGQVAVRTLEPDPEAGALGHSVTAAALLTMTRQIFGRVPPACIETVCARDFSFGFELSPPVEAALPEARRKAESALAGLAGRNDCGGPASR